MSNVIAFPQLEDVRAVNLTDDIASGRKDLGETSSMAMVMLANVGETLRSIDLENIDTLSDEQISGLIDVLNDDRDNACWIMATFSEYPDIVSVAKSLLMGIFYALTTILPFCMDDAEGEQA